MQYEYLLRDSGLKILFQLLPLNTDQSHLSIHHVVSPILSSTVAVQVMVRNNSTEAIIIQTHIPAHLQTYLHICPTNHPKACLLSLCKEQGLSLFQYLCDTPGSFQSRTQVPGEGSHCPKPQQVYSPLVHCLVFMFKD